MSFIDRLAGRALAPHRPALALVVLACMLYLPCVWTRGLWSPDEPRYAEVTRQMAVRGDWILPHLNGAVYSEKPPLFFWLGMAASALPGVPAGAGLRLVSVLAALGTLLLTFRLGRRLFDAETGWIAALVLATSSMFLLHATSGVIDATLTLIVTAAIGVALRARETGSAVLWAIFYALAGLGVLAKGPVGFLVPAGAIFLLALIEDGPRRAWAAHPLWGVPIAALVVAAWIVPAIARGGESYAEIILLKQNVGRAYQSWHHQEPATYFLRVFPGAFLPWIVALPVGIAAAWRARGRRPGARAALAWFAFTFIFFSIISGKKTRYLLPLFPAASLLAAFALTHARALARAGQPGDRPRRVRGAPIATGLILALSLAGAVTLLAGGGGLLTDLVHTRDGLASDQRDALTRFASWPWNLALLAPGLVAAAVSLAGLLRLGRDTRAALGCCLLSLFVLIGWAQWVAVPALDPIKSAAATAQVAARLAGDSGEIVLYRDSFAGKFNAALGRDRIPLIRRPAAMAAYAEDHRQAVVIGPRDAMKKLAAGSGPPHFEDCRHIGGDEVCVARAGALVAPAR